MSCEYSLELSCRGGSNEYQQSMLRAKIYKIMYTPCNLSFTYIKVEFKGLKLCRYVFLMPAMRLLF